MPSRMIKFLFLLSFLKKIDSKGILSMTFDKYTNEENTLLKGNCCNSETSICRYECGAIFEICLSNVASPNSCSISKGKVLTKFYTYGKRISFQDDPLRFSLDEPTEPILFEIIVYAEETRKRVVANFTDKNFNKVPIQSNGSTSLSFESKSRRYPSKILVANFTLHCTDFYEPPDCKHKCIAHDDVTGHYQCHETNGKICMPGWIDVGSNCTRRNESYPELKSTLISSIKPSYTTNIVINTVENLTSLSTIFKMARTSQYASSFIDNLTTNSYFLSPKAISSTLIISITSSIYQSSISNSTLFNSKLSTSFGKDNQPHSTVEFSSAVSSNHFKVSLYSTMYGSSMLGSSEILTSYQPTATKTSRKSISSGWISKQQQTTQLSKVSTSFLSVSSSNYHLKNATKATKLIPSEAIVIKTSGVTASEIKSIANSLIAASMSKNTNKNTGSSVKRQLSVQLSSNSLVNKELPKYGMAENKKKENNDWIYITVGTLGCLLILLVTLVFAGKHRHFKQKNKVNPSQQYEVDVGAEEGNSDESETQFNDGVSDTSIGLSTANTFRIEMLRTKNKLDSGTGTYFMNPPPNVPISSL